MAEFNCPPNTYCSDQQATEVGANKTKIYHRTVTTLTGTGPAYTGSKTETYILRRQPDGAPIDSWQVAATTTDGGKTQTFTDAAGADLRKSLSLGGNLTKNTQIQTQKTLAKGLGTNASGETGTVLDKINPEQQKKLKIVDPNAASPIGAGTTTDGTAKVNEEDLAKEQTSAQGRDVKDYPNLRYPETLSSKQDCIQFKILKSEPRPLGTTAGISGPRSKTSSRSGGSVTLPISGPVSDSNRVTYGPDSLTPVEAFFESLSRAAVTGGGDGAGKELDKAGNTVKNNTGEIKTAVANEAVKAATGVNALTRRFGLVVNPNMELLFNGPELRSFSFTFRLTPRSEEEAIIVRKIIRFFKQGMSAQRTKSQIYLSTPNSFEIQYLTGGKLHPYLPKIKECALTDCSVNYAPDGTYMTYNGTETSMTAYDLSLQFSELEPIFNDEYPKDSDATIGY
jgi:hypothetical protein